MKGFKTLLATLLLSMTLVACAEYDDDYYEEFDEYEDEFEEDDD